MSRARLSVLVLAKRRPGLNECLEILSRFPADVRPIIGDRGDPLPGPCMEWKGDLLVSYIAPWIVPASVLSRAGVAAVNFHPGPPEYPGIGCTNFAVYHGERRYGVTAHHMAEQVDAGAIIAVRRFAISPEETVSTVTQRAHQNLRTLFEEVMSAFFSTGAFTVSGETWKRKAYTRRDLEELCRITPAMPRAEVERRIHATRYPGMPGAYVEIHGHRFDYSARPGNEPNTGK